MLDNVTIEIFLMSNFTYQQYPHRDIQCQREDAIAGPLSLAQIDAI